MCFQFTKCKTGGGKKGKEEKCLDGLQGNFGKKNFLL